MPSSGGARYTGAMLTPKISTRSFAASFVLAAIVFFSAPARADGCYADWSDAAPIVKKEGLTTIETLAETARGKLSGDIVKTTLCEEEGGFVYRLLIREPAGRLVNRTVDARIPFPR
jgi:uncharacterized membrane protein YkoI